MHIEVDDEVLERLNAYKRDEFESLNDVLRRLVGCPLPSCNQTYKAKIWTTNGGGDPIQQYITFTCTHVKGHSGPHSCYEDALRS